MAFEINDSMTRTVTTLTAAGASSVPIKNPLRALIKGEWITFAGHATEYQVTGSTASSVSFTPVLTAQVAAAELLTRFDKYGLITVEDWTDELQEKYSTVSDGRKTEIYKKLLSARSRIEKRLDGPIVSRSYTEKYSIDPHVTYYPGMVYPPVTRLYTKHWPIVSVASITIDDSAVSSSDYEVIDGDYIWYESGWPRGENNIEVTYTAGYTYPEFEFRELFFNVTNFLISLSPSGKDLMIVGSNEGATGPAVGQSIRSLEDIDKYIDMHLHQYRRVNI